MPCLGCVRLHRNAVLLLQQDNVIVIKLPAPISIQQLKLLSDVCEHVTVHHFKLNQHAAYEFMFGDAAAIVFCQHLLEVDVEVVRLHHCRDLAECVGNSAHDGDDPE